MVTVDQTKETRDKELLGKVQLKKLQRFILEAVVDYAAKTLSGVSISEVNFTVRKMKEAHMSKSVTIKEKKGKLPNLLMDQTRMDQAAVSGTSGDPHMRVK
ncbi:hypothetical protein LWI28_021528 [Acer negundo]|uniref:Uncharacterized protein n=1 Tax=Acer negundo TaxID=4023 RepID=A0AAD5JE61_ACENE|nr:hypothetical protein LWI28_021528 [Acer negundo]